MIKKSLEGWQRIEFEKTSVYIKPEDPDWFVPNAEADEWLKDLLVGKKESTNVNFENLLSRIDTKKRDGYQGRAIKLCLERLKECWIHITNRCNMTCKHCMFRSSPLASQELNHEQVMRVIDEALRLGCRIFYFTGGEPFLHASFFPALKKIFAIPETHVIVLTNLTLIKRSAQDLSVFPKDRLHFQVSIDGIGKKHDELRGEGAFEKLKINLKELKKQGFPSTLAMAVTRQNISDMERLVDFAFEYGISNIHFLWLFVKGLADDSLFVGPLQIYPHLIKAQKGAEKKGVKIDNIEILFSQVFSCPGTKYDLYNAGWQSLAVGPDGNVYPTPALIYEEKLICGHIKEGLEKVWRKSPVLQKVRKTSLIDDKGYNQNPFKFLVGGGDIDHSYIYGGKLVGADPYLELYNNIAKWLIVREAKLCKTGKQPAFQLKMGEKLGECPIEGGEVFFTHSNCVLSLPGHETHALVNRFYTEAAKEPLEEIQNPILYPEELISHIPEESRFRSYGCGSPVVDAKLKSGDVVVDLGSGTGVECFIASRQVGPDGKVYGIDMGDAMLKVASESKEKVIKQLGYSNIEFKKAFLEKLPLDDNSVDVFISNCVINLSPDKRMVFSEIMRALKPGGRLMVSDITYDEDIPLDIKYNEKLRGECIGGALCYRDLFGLLEDLGFSESKMTKGFSYRTVKGYAFYSITYEAFKPAKEEEAVIQARRPFKEALSEVESEPTCACFVKPEAAEKENEIKKGKIYISGCMACGAKLEYLPIEKELECFYCGRRKRANSICKNEHFICDACHSSDAIEIIKLVCLNSKEMDMVALMKKIISHPAIPLNGPEYHSLVPAVILAVYRNSGGKLSDEQILEGIDRGATVAGGSCAFLGVCGAAIGVGIAFAIILGADPFQGKKRQIAQKVTQQVLGKIAAFEAPRCCHRDCWIALKQTSVLSSEILGMKLKADEKFSCAQTARNNECIREKCPLWPC